MKTTLPTIVVPSIVSSTIYCDALTNCSTALGTYSVSPSCSGATLQYSFTYNGITITPATWVNYQMNLTT